MMKEFIEKKKESEVFIVYLILSRNRKMRRIARVRMFRMLLVIAKSKSVFVSLKSRNSSARLPLLLM